MFGFISVAFLDIFLINLHNGREPINNELFEEAAIKDGVALFLDGYYLQARQILQLGYLQQGEDVVVLELQGFQPLESLEQAHDAGLDQKLDENILKSDFLDFLLEAGIV